MRAGAADPCRVSSPRFFFFFSSLMALFNYKPHPWGAGKQQKKASFFSLFPSRSCDQNSSIEGSWWINLDKNTRAAPGAGWGREMTEMTFSLLFKIIPRSPSPAFAPPERFRHPGEGNESPAGASGKGILPWRRRGGFRAGLAGLGLYLVVFPVPISIKTPFL